MSLVGGTLKDMRLRELSMRHKLKQGLASLPKPKETEWELEIPEEQREVMATEEVEEDAEVRDQREQAIREAQEQLERKRRTQVMQKELPRPEFVDIEALVQDASTVSDPLERLIAKEAALLIANDAVRYPLPGSRVKGKPFQLQRIDDSPLAEARLKILMEVKSDPKPEEVQAVWEREHNNALLLGLGCYGDEDDEEQTAAMKAALESVQESMVSTAERCKKLEKKLKLHLGGYQQRAKTLRSKIGEAAEALEKATSALNAFKTLQISEEIAIRSRREALMEEVNYISRREREAQEMYRQAKEELDSLDDGVNGYH